MQYLTKENAQKIADRIMKIVPYNINIMNKDGIIIASGDESRIGTVHKGALKALEMKEAYIVYQDTETERKGINLPIFYNYEIAGIIGISGDVDNVMQIGRIVVTTAELMIENDVYNDISVIKENRFNDFLYEWSQRKENEYTDKFIAQAEYFHIDITKKRVAVHIQVKRVRYSVIEQVKFILSPEDYIVRQNMEGMLLVFLYDAGFERRLKEVLSVSKDLCNCYIGEPDTVVWRTVNSAEKVREVAEKMKKTDRVLDYRDLQLECLLSGIDVDQSLLELERILEEKDSDGVLQDTLIAYASYNENHSKVCELLHVHRNTLNYRLDKIYEITGKNPRNGKDLALLYLLLLHRMTETQTASV